MIRKYIQNPTYFEAITLFLILKWALLEKKYHKEDGADRLGRVLLSMGLILRPKREL